MNTEPTTPDHPKRDCPKPDQQNTSEASDPPPQPSKRRRRPLISLLRIVLVVYIAMLVIMKMMEPTLVYPGAYGLGRPLDPNLDTSSFMSKPWEYSTIDGGRIVGRLLDRPEAKRTILFLHGNGVQAVMLDPWIERLSRTLNANVLAAEYRGFQSEDITPNESNVVADALAAHDALCEYYNLSSEDVIVYGRSLGGGCAAAVASERETRTLILESTFDSAVNVAAERFPFIPVRWLMRNQFDSVGRLREFKGRLIQIHGSSDSIVPIRRGKALHESVDSDDKVFLEIADKRHNDHLDDRLLQRLRDLL